MVIGTFAQCNLIASIPMLKKFQSSDYWHWFVRMYSDPWSSTFHNGLPSPLTSSKYSHLLFKEKVSMQRNLFNSICENQSNCITNVVQSFPSTIINKFSNLGEWKKDHFTFRYSCFALYSFAMYPSRKERKRDVSRYVTAFLLVSTYSLESLIVCLYSWN